MTIKITALGTGGAFTKYYHNNYVLEHGDVKLLIDTGTTLRNSLHVAGYKETDITDVIITHLHSDHVGGLEEFAQRCKWMFNHKPNLWIREDMAEDLLEVVGHGLFTDGLELEDYFRVNTFNAGDDSGFNIQELFVIAIDTDNLHCKGMKSNAFSFYNELDNLIFSGDIKNLKMSYLNEYISPSTLAIFQDTSLAPNGVHSDINEVLEYYGKAKKIVYAMHYQDGINIEENEKKYGIKFVVPQRAYEF